MSDAVEQFLGRLDALGVPLFTTTPRHGSGGGEYVNLAAWSSLDAAGNADRLRDRRAEDAVRGVMGGRVAVVDVDTKNGADAEGARQWLDDLGVRVCADVLTPSGGRHYYVAGHPDLPTLHAAAGRDALDGLPGVEILSFGTNVFLPGTARPKYDGATYIVLTDALDALLDEPDADGETLAAWVAEHRAGRPAAPEWEPAPRWAGGDPGRRERAYLDAALAGMVERVAATGEGGRNEALHRAALAAGNYIAGAGMDERTAVEALLEAARRNGLVDDDGERSCLATIRSGIRFGRGRPRAVPPPADRGEQPAAGAVDGRVRDRVEVSGEDPLPLLAELLADLRGWHHVPDPSHVALTLAAAVTRGAEGEPSWVLLVAPPSSGKTEAVRLLDQVADDRLDEVTAAGLLGWSKGKNPRPSGVLARASERALLTIGDLSTLLATSDRGGRDQLFSLLRRAYDGSVHRDVSPPGRVEGTGQLSWSGRLTVIGCVTGAIDRAAAHSAELGPRWLYVRLPERDTAAKRRASRLARAGGLAERRRNAAGLAARIVAAATPRVPDDVPEAVADVIEDAALVTSWGRAAVPRNGYGRREIEGVPVVEEPMRLVQQLACLARGVLALGMPEAAAVVLVRRVALDSMPEARRGVLAALSSGELLSTAGVARAAGLDRKVTRFQLEELAAVGVVEHDRDDDEDDEPSGPVHWSLTGDDGALIASVFVDHGRGGGWDEMLVHTSTSPPNKGEREGDMRFQPTVRPTPQPAEPTCHVCGVELSEDRAAYGRTTCAEHYEQEAS